MVNETKYRNKLVLLLGVVSLFACSTPPPPKPVPPPDPYKIVSPGKFTAKLPSAKWRRMDNSRDLQLYTPALVNIYFKKDSGSTILVRVGRRVGFGIPNDYDLTTGQLVYLSKTVPKGDFIGREDFDSKNPLLERAKKLVRFKVDHPKLGPGQITATMVQRGEILLIEFFAPQAVVAEDEPEFFIFLDSLQEVKQEAEKE